MSLRWARKILSTGTVVIAAAGGLLVTSPPSAATSDPQRPPIDASAKDPEVRLEATNQIPGDLTGGDTDPVSSDRWVYRKRESSCEGINEATACLQVACANPDEVGYLVERRRPHDATQNWQLDGIICEGPTGPVLTPDRVLEEVRRVGLPSMSVHAPPETFVNYETVVYTKAETFARTVNLLGFTVDIEATPSRFRWDYGDGATETTATAGRPYPATDITHTWTDAHRTFHPSVDVTYQIRYRVDGGAWQTLGDTITAQGPDSDVRIREATGMLANMH